MTIILNYGMGVESTTILKRWLTEPKSRDFDLADLVVLTAQTGNEFPDTKERVEKYLFPLLRKNKVRYVQVARSGRLQQEGFTILDDTRKPTHLCVEGEYTLMEELLSSGTVPQFAKKQRRCTFKFKGFPLSSWTSQYLGWRSGRLVLGYNADEVERRDRAEGYTSLKRPFEYPLIDWGWGRQQCLDYLYKWTGEHWPKSCCSMCPFTRGKEWSLARYALFPAQAADALYLEHMAMALNPRSTLYAHGSLADALRNDPKNNHGNAFGLLEDMLERASWCVYQVRRVYHKKGRADRSTVKHGGGTQKQALTRLRKIAKQEGMVVERLGSHDRFLLYRRQEGVYPTIEEFYVAAPNHAEQKQRKSFELNWLKTELRVVPN